MSSLPVPPPPCLSEATSSIVPTNPKLLTGPGPSNVSQRVLSAMSLPALGHLHPEFTRVMDDVKAGVQYIFQTKNDVTLALSATGHAAMEAVMVNLVEDGDVVLIADNGIWGERSADMARRQGGDVRTMKNPPGVAFKLEEFERALEKEKPSLLFVTHGESSTGCLQDLTGIGELCRRSVMGY